MNSETGADFGTRGPLAEDAIRGREDVLDGSKDAVDGGEDATGAPNRDARREAHQAKMRGARDA